MSGPIEEMVIVLNQALDYLHDAQSRCDVLSDGNQGSITQAGLEVAAADERLGHAIELARRVWHVAPGPTMAADGLGVLEHAQFAQERLNLSIRALANTQRMIGDAVSPMLAMEEKIRAMLASLRGQA